MTSNHPISELRDSELRFRIIADFSFDWETWILPDGSPAYISPACERITGYSREELLARPELLFEIVHPDDREKLLDHHCRHLDRLGQESELEFRIVTRQGEVRWIWHQCQPIVADDGRWLGRRATNRDITRLRKTERALRQEQRLFNAGPTVVFRWKATRGWPVEYVSANVETIFGYAAADLLENRIAYADIIHPDDLERVSAEVRAHCNPEADRFVQQYRLIHGDGRTCWVHDTTRILRDDQGRITHYHGYLVDISRQKEHEEALRLVEKQLENAQKIAKVGYWQWDSRSRRFNISEAVYSVLGLDPVTFVPSRSAILHLVHPEDRRQVASFFADMEHHAGGDSIEFRVRKDGADHFLCLRVEYEDAVDDEGRSIGKHGSFQDISAIRKTQSQLVLFDKIFTNTIEGIVVTDAEGIIREMNPAGQRITGYAASEVIGKDTSVFKSDRHPQGFYESMWDAVREKGFWQGEIWSRRKNGEIYPVQMQLTSLGDSNGRLSSVIFVFHDMTEIRSQEKELQFQTYHDALTGLPNRVLLLDRLKVALRNARQLGRKLALIMLDLDDFKEINDALGHTVGDLLLQQAAMRIRKCVRENDTVARQGSDDFIILLENITDVQTAADTAQRLSESFQPPFAIEGRQLFITISAGVAVAPDDGEDEETLIGNADLAMYRAKEEGKNTYRLFTTELNEKITRRFSLSTRLRHALDNDEFLVYYQPKVDLIRRRIVGLEALVRWEPEPGEVISPAEFIPLAEETGLIIPLAMRVLVDACRQTVRWRNMGFDLTVSVNLSARQFTQENFLSSVGEALLASGLPAGALELEITETLMMEREDLAIGLLWELKKMGITISVDDFGTGYSSLAYLKQLPIDILKIDRSFVRNLPEDEDDTVLAATIINMAASLGLGVIAEGVETQEQAHFMCEHGCRLIQGFLVSPPVPAGRMTDLLRLPAEKILKGFSCKDPACVRTAQRSRKKAERPIALSTHQKRENQ
ncbi:EAL domain-containing protein [Thermodesulfobacteriota bacterium B35]